MGKSLNGVLNQETDTTIPTGWCTTTLGEIVTLQRGSDLPVSQRESGDVPVVGSSGVVGYHSEAVSKGPGVLVGRSGSVGSVNWIEGDYWPLNTALWVKDFHNNDPQFVYYLLSSLHLAAAATGVSVPTLNRNLVHPLRVIVPGVPEQRAIAHVLRTVQRAKEATERVISTVKAVKQSLMRHLFSHGACKISGERTGGANRNRDWATSKRMARDPLWRCL